MDPTSQRLLMASKPVIVQTYDIAGTYTWTAPTGVTQVLSLIGSGGSGNTVTQFGNYTTAPAAYFYLIGTFDINNAFPNDYPTVVGSALTYGDMRTRISNNLLPTWQAITTNTAGNNYTISSESYNYRSGNWYRGTFGIGTIKYRRTGTATAVGMNLGSNPDVMTGANTAEISTTSITYGAYAANIEAEYTTINTGGTSSALGFTFTGSSNNTPTQSTQSNISVTPGSNYTIVVGQNYGTVNASIITLVY